MIPHDILTLYGAKGLEYVIAIAFLVLFVPFWRYAMGTRPAPEPAFVRAAQAAPAHSDLVEWFRVARDVFYHPGHAWARAAEAAGAVLVGADDFAQKLVGPLRTIELPAPGTAVRQGEPAWRLHAGDKALSQLKASVTSNTRNQAGGEIEGRWVGGQPLAMHVEQIDANSIRVKIRVGQSGDRMAEDAIQAGIRENL